MGYRFVISKILIYVFSCRIHDCVIGSGVVIGGDCVLMNSYVAAGCKIPDGAKIES